MSFAEQMSKKIKQWLQGFKAAQDPVGEQPAAGCRRPEAEDWVRPKMRALLRRAAAEGCVLLKNSGVLPLREGERISVFGRVQQDYFYTGSGSGGDLRSPYCVSLMDALRNNPHIEVNEALAAVYETFCTQHRPKQKGSGRWPWHHEEMPLKISAIREAAAQRGTAIVVIGRGAGEGRDAVLRPGSYYLARDERSLLNQVTMCFDKVVVVINSGNVMDLSFVVDYGNQIDAVLLCWQGGMESGNAVADVLTGLVNPCGRLTDTLSRRYRNQPSAKDFGGLWYNHYAEDIFVGYRYFERFAPTKVQYPFGYGLSYTTFSTALLYAERQGAYINVRVRVENTGSCSGKEVVQFYAGLPRGKLTKPKHVLIAFCKTKELAPRETQDLTLTASIRDLASYDDQGLTGYKHALLLEWGPYHFYLGNNIRETKPVWMFQVSETMVLAHLESVMEIPAQHRFLRLAAQAGGRSQEPAWEMVPRPERSLVRRILQRLPKPIAKETKDRPAADEVPAAPLHPLDPRHPPEETGFSFAEVLEGRRTVREFVSTLTDEELCSLTRGGGVNSRLGVPGNAGTYGGVTEALRRRGIPVITAADGPAGIRIQAVCALLPCAAALCSTWDTALVEELYGELGLKMRDQGVQLLLAPGMNIHRSPLNGRNFASFSEDPLLTGKMAAAVVRGLQSKGVGACLKHFACNQQEKGRTFNDSRVSQRALREVYLRGFEICIRESNPVSVMTGRNKINGVWSRYNYDLCTTVLREEWGYTGMVMTDGGSCHARSPDFPDVKGDAYRIRAQVDLLMPGECRCRKDSLRDCVLGKLEQGGGLKRAELQRSAVNILSSIKQLGGSAGKQACIRHEALRNETKRP